MKATLSFSANTNKTIITLKVQHSYTLFVQIYSRTPELNQLSCKIKMFPGLSLMQTLVYLYFCGRYVILKMQFIQCRKVWKASSLSSAWQGLTNNTMQTIGRTSCHNAQQRISMWKKNRQTYTLDEVQIVIMHFHITELLCVGISEHFYTKYFVLMTCKSQLIWASL